MPIFTENNRVEKGLSFMLFGGYKLNIPLPPLPEQRRIAEILSAVDRKLELERRRKEKLERVKKGLMNELLTGRKRIQAE
ncbi:MAG: restriction endonuclease subunit S [Candidatus Methanoperedenaceae archaeon]|nr:restriction endonuclease subunit S [Candidatus Methanoperedenaceae archaeon]